MRDAQTGRMLKSAGRGEGEKRVGDCKKGGRVRTFKKTPLSSRTKDWRFVRGRGGGDDADSRRGGNRKRGRELSQMRGLSSLPISHISGGRNEKGRKKRTPKARTYNLARNSIYATLREWKDKGAGKKLNTDIRGNLIQSSQAFRYRPKKTVIDESKKGERHEGKRGRESAEKREGRGE